MKNELVLDNYGVQELQAVEKQEVDGGFVITGISSGLAFIKVSYAEIKEAFRDITEGYEHCSKRLNNGG